MIFWRWLKNNSTNTILTIGNLLIVQHQIKYGHVILHETVALIKMSMYIFPSIFFLFQVLKFWVHRTRVLFYTANWSFTYSKSDNNEYRTQYQRISCNTRLLRIRYQLLQKVPSTKGLVFVRGGICFVLRLSMQVDVYPKTGKGHISVTGVQRRFFFLNI